MEWPSEFKELLLGKLLFLFVCDFYCFCFAVSLNFGGDVFSGAKPSILFASNQSLTTADNRRDANDLCRFLARVMKA